MTAHNAQLSERIINVGPAGFHPPSAMELGVTIPDSGQGLLYGRHAPDDEVIKEAARQLFTRKNPTIFPGPLYLWAWNQEWIAKGQALLRLAAEIPNVILIPMPDYRPKYPKIDPEEGINPNHPNLTIWQNKIDVCLFVGVHCHQSNIALKIIRGGTNCFTIALCTFNGDDEAHVTIRDLTADTIQCIVDAVHRQKRSRPS